MQRWWSVSVVTGLVAGSMIVSSPESEAGRRRRCCQPVVSCCQPVASTCQGCAPACGAAAPAATTGAYEEPPAPSTAPATPTLYERLGGEAAIKAVVEEFVGLAAADEQVNFFRKGTDKEWKPGEGDVDKLKMHLVNLIGQLTGGPQKYTGKAMKAAHAGMKITEGEFNALAGDLIKALDKFKVPQAEKDELIAIVASTKGDIVEAK